MTTTEPDADLTQMIAEDHRLLERVFTELEEQTSIGWEYRRQLVDHLIASLVRHTVAEEQYLYPEVRERLDGGDALADEEIAQHNQAEELMKELEGAAPADTRFEQLLGDLVRHAREHFQEEEESLLPRLKAACTLDHLQQLGAKMQLAKDSAPIHPHPGAPDTPPSNLIIDPAIGIIDKVRDGLKSAD